MTCMICDKTHRCADCGTWFATMEEQPGDSRPDCTYCLSCWWARETAEVQAAWDRDLAAIALVS